MNTWPVTLRKGGAAALAGVLLAVLSACVSVGVGGDLPPQAYQQLHDAATAAPRRSAPLAAALLIQPLPADATADTTSIAYSRRPHEFAYYQLAQWAERPVRSVPRLLQQRLEARGVVGAVGLVGEPVRADWMLTVAVETVHHDVSVQPGQGRVALTVELFDRRNRTRIARQRFEGAAPAASADAPAGAAAMSQALTQAFDALVPWLEAQWPPAAAAAPK